MGIILLLSAVFAVNPVEFFTAARNNIVINVAWLFLLYGLILSTIHFSIVREGGTGIKDLGLSLDKKVIFKTLRNLLIVFFLFGCYLFLLLKSGHTVFKSADLYYVLTEVLKAVLFGLLFAFVEEIFFRGYVYTRLLDDIPSPLAIIVVNLLFACLHLFRPGNPPFKVMYFIGLFLVGTILSIIYIKTRSLWMPVSVHMGWVACMYLLASPLFDFNRRICGYSVLFGLENCPVAGIAGYTVVLLTGFMVVNIRKDW